MINDWGTSYHCARELGPKAFCLVDLGHHAPNVNIEMIVARLIQFGKLAGFHFNDSKYGDDDLDAGSIKPFQLFLIFNELVDAELGEVPGFDPAYMLDQSHNVTDPVESLMASAVELVRAYVQAHLVDREALRDAQEGNDALHGPGHAQAGLHHRRGADPGHGPPARGRRHRSHRRPSARAAIGSARRRSGRPRARRRRGNRLEPPVTPLFVAVDLGAGQRARVPGRRLASGRAARSTRCRRFQLPAARARDGHLRWDCARGSSARSTPACARRAERARGLGRPVHEHRGRQLGRGLRPPRRRTGGCSRTPSATATRARRACQAGSSRGSRATRSSRAPASSSSTSTRSSSSTRTIARGCPPRRGRLLLIPDLVHHRLTGRAVTEYTNATTTQLVGADTAEWDDALVERLGLPARPARRDRARRGRDLGPLTRERAAELGLEGVRVVAPATHDTGSAVAGAPLARRVGLHLLRHLVARRRRARGRRS